jgi:hypothetical protein
MEETALIFIRGMGGWCYQASSGDEELAGVLGIVLIMKAPLPAGKVFFQLFGLDVPWKKQRHRSDEGRWHSVNVRRRQLKCILDYFAARIAFIRQ